MRLRPMRAATIRNPVTDVTYPMLGSPKLDGIRVLIRNEDLLSRKLKLIPNKELHEVFGLGYLHGADGELIAGKPTGPGVWNRTDSVVMSHDHPDTDTVNLYVFDRWDMPQEAYVNRIASAEHRFTKYKHPRVIIVPQVLIKSPKELLAFHRRLVAKGYEGSMYRDPNGGYKRGRSTLDEAYLLKFKDFEDCEVRIVGFKEEKENRNPLTTNKLGYAKRSSHKANKVGKKQVGAFIVKALNGTYKGRTFPVGMGIGDVLATAAWRKPSVALNHVGVVRYRVEAGADKPWNCSWKGFRDD